MAREQWCTLLAPVTWVGLPSPSKEESKKVCLSGTSEMALGGWLRNHSFTEEQLPLKLCAVSRCYRAETSKLKLEQGIFRVHHFTKVEMFGITSNETGQESDDLYQELVQIQIELLQGLGLHGQVVLMPPEELGNPAYSKTDLEVWLPGRRRYAELTSASNCTSYQAARLGASYVNKKGQRKLVHTVNGTAVAVPRCIIALCETHQEATGRRALQLPAFLGLAPAHPQQFQPNETSVDTGHEHNAFLNKVMVYNEQCLRKVLPLKNYEDLIDSDEN
ncbi:serine--tRNA ligase, mitochondrial isoform X2 [Hyalella azteca]|uniref:serine--tRNA ligase n=1 Tax=Hyalella azteca TaxID=294128 RepID=A0A8B7PGN5_HYAAZ|nr:serine--tRNA ligase, mitochondrial isoform X2 [Hyalella azteca]